MLALVFGCAGIAKLRRPSTSVQNLINFGIPRQLAPATGLMINDVVAAIECEIQVAIEAGDHLECGGIESPDFLWITIIRSPPSESLQPMEQLVDITFQRKPVDSPKVAGPGVPHAAAPHARR